MANTLRFKRGLVAGLPTALAGEPLFTTDTFDLYIGNGTTNTRFQKYIASGTTSQLLRGDGSLLTMPIVLTSPSTGQVLKYNGTSWVNDSDAGITGSGAAGQVAYFTGATTQTGSNNLFWDATNSRLGIGTNNPLLNVVINSASGSNATLALSENNLLRWYTRHNAGTGNFEIVDVVNTLTRLIVTNTGNLGLGVTPSTWAASRSKIEFSSAGTTAGFVGCFAGSSANNQMGLGSNAYFNASSVWTYSNTGGAAGYYAVKNNVHEWHIAPSGTAGNAITFTQAMTLTANGRLLLGTTTEGTQILQVTGDTLMKGSGATSATIGLNVQDSASTNLFRLRNDGSAILRNGLYFGTSTNNLIISSNASNTVDVAGLNLSLLFGSFDTAGYGVIIGGFNASTRTVTSGASGTLQIGHGYAPTSGTGTYTMLNAIGTINQTGGANGITRGLYVSPTLTAAADWRSIEWSNNTGWGLYGAGTANNYLAGSLAIGSTNVFAKLYVAGGTTTATTQTYIGSQPTINQAVTNLQSFWSNIVGNLASTITNAHSYIATQSSIASSTITNLFGFTADSSLSTATNIYGFYGNIASGTGRWNLYMNGTAANYLAGELYVGGTTAYGATITSYGSATRSGGIGIRNSAGTIAGFFGTYAAGSGSGSTDILVESAGFISFATAGTEKMKLFGATGNLSIGSVTPDTGEKLQVTGTMKVTGAATFSSSVTAASLVVDTTTLVVDATNDRVGIGTASPAAKLHLVSASGDHIKIDRTGQTDRAILINASNQFAFGTWASPNQFTLDSNGAATFSSSVTASDSCTITRSQNGNTKLTITNINTGGNASAFTEYNNASSGALYGKRGSAASTYKILTPHDAILYNYTEGNISILNDFATGTIKMTSGGASNAHLTIAASGSATFSNAATFQSTITTTQLNLSALNTAPANSTDTGTVGEIRIDANHIYVCTATNTWKRVAIATF